LVQPQNGTGPVTHYLSDLAAVASTRVASAAALSALPATVGGSAVRLGYATAGDAPALLYNLSGSACAVNSGAGDGGSQIPASGGGCWLASFPGSADVREWGAAPGAQSDSALNAAIAYACATHTPLTLPYPGNNPYLINSSIQIGNGNATTLSTCNGVSLTITRPYNASSSGTTPAGYLAFKYNGGSSTTVPFVVQGPATQIELSGVGVNCNNVCKTGIRLTNIIEGRFHDLGVEQNVGPCMVFDSVLNNTWQGSLEGVVFRNLQCQSPATGGSGLQVGLDDCLTYCAAGPPVIAVTFENTTMNWDGATANTFGVRLGFLSQSTFINLRLAPASGGLGNPIVVRPPANTGGTGGGAFPTDLVLLHPLVDTTETAVRVDTTNNAWAPSFGGLNILGWSTVWQGFPTYATNPGVITGFDTNGRAWPGALNWTPIDASGASLTFTVQDATYSLNGNACNVVLSLTYPATANGSAASIAGLPSVCLPIAGSGTSRIAGTVAFSTYATPITALMNNAGAISFYAYGGTGVSNAALSGRALRLNFSTPVN
jgi:hypothetical protein